VNEWHKPIEELSDAAQGYLFSSVATNLIYLGDITAVVEPSLRSINWFVQNEQWVEAASAAGPLVSMLIAAGDLSKAISLMNDMQAVIGKSQNLLVIAMAANFRAYVYYLNGQIALAKENFDHSEKVLNRLQPADSLPLPTISSYYCKFLLDTGKQQEALERSLKTFAWREQRTWQVAIDTTSLLATDLLVLGLTFLQIGDHINAKIQLDKQVELFKSADEWLYLPTGLNSRARLHIATENFGEALRDLQESLEISLRTGARFGEWEAYIDMAQLYYKRHKYDLSSEYLKKAFDLPNMDKYRFRDGEVSELLENLSSKMSKSTREHDSSSQ